MITRITKSLLLLAACAMVSLAAAPPVASVIGNAPIDVSGIPTPARTLVPVAVGDEVTTQAGPAFVQFRDGSKVVLQPDSQLQIEGQQADPSVRVVRGSATYDLVPTSKLRVTNSKGETVNQILDGALPANDPSSNRLNSPLSQAVIYRNSASRQVGMVLPTSFAMTGNFVLTASPGAAITSGTAQIIGPSGLTINLKAVTDPITNVTTFVVTSITQVVTNPTTGLPVTLNITSSQLIGTTVSSVTSSTQSGATVTIQFTPPGSSTPLPQAQAGGLLNAGLNKAVQDAGLPPSTASSTPKPATTGTFSPTGP